ncbi:MAG: hypothetical protein H6553_00780 [Chitinophagales bacterium]|nr:hypothetical protein [Chitinophagales bacterium]
MSNVFLLSFVLLLSSCQGNKTTKIDSNSSTVVDSVSDFKKQKVQQYKEKSIEEQIDERVKYIDSIKPMANKGTIELEESTEGGEATFYYYENRLIKIETHHFGEMGKKDSYYYADEKWKLIFYREILEQYSQPIYLSDAENIKSEIFQTQLFIRDNQLINYKFLGDYDTAMAEEEAEAIMQQTIDKYNYYLEISQ